MAAGVKHKVFRWNEPKGLRLAKLVYDRCKKNVERYARTHKNERAGISAMESRGLALVYFTMDGRTARDEENYRKAYANRYRGGGFDDVERKVKTDGVLVLPAEHYGAGDGTGTKVYNREAFGWEVYVRIRLKTQDDEPVFGVEVYDERGSPPGEMRRCLESTYNDLVEEHGMADES